MALIFHQFASVELFSLQRYLFLGHRKCVCAFGNPLEIDNHNKTEAGAILGKIT